MCIKDGKVGVERRLTRAPSSYVISVMRVNPARVAETMQKLLLATALTTAWGSDSFLHSHQLGKN
jgi:hypothetical protein